MVINMLQNRNHKYYSHNNNIKYENLTIKFLSFELIYYVINLDVVSFFMIFNNFDYKFVLIYY